MAHSAIATSPSEEPAVTRVLNTTELLEQILLNLDMKTLLLSQRTNRQFKAVIDGSIKLQQRLFFRHAPEDGHRHVQQEVNSMLRTDRHKGSGGLDDAYCVVYYYPLCIRWYLDTSATAADPTPSWRRMYPAHGSFTNYASEQAYVALCYTLVRCGESNGECFSLPAEPKTMGEYEAIALSRIWEMATEEDALMEAAARNPLYRDKPTYIDLTGPDEDEWTEERRELRERLRITRTTY